MRAATAANAELLGLGPELGAISEGMLADAIVVRGDLTRNAQPLIDNANLVAILQAGRRIPRLRAEFPA